MKKLLPGIFIQLILFSCLFQLNAQSLEELIDLHIKAHGGHEKWEKVKTLEVKGKFTSFSIENDFRSLRTQDGKYYADLYIGEQAVVEAFDGEAGWTIDPWQDIEYPRKLNEVEKNAFFQKAMFFTPFYNYKEKGSEAKYIGKNKIDGIEVFEIELKRKNGNIESWFLDAETYLEYSYKSIWVDFAFPAPGETYFDDFREVEGLLIPFFIERTFFQRDHILQIEELNINPDFDPNIFDEPIRKEINKLGFLIGDWDVEIETWTGRDWYKLGKSTSEITFVSKNMLQEKLSYERIFPVSKWVTYTYSEKHKKYMVSVFNDLPSTQLFFTGSLNDSTFVFDNTEIDIGKEEKKDLIRYEVSNIEENSFTLELKRSMDGSTWNPGDRFVYARKD